MQTLKGSKKQDHLLLHGVDDVMLFIEKQWTKKWTIFFLLIRERIFLQNKITDVNPKLLSFAEIILN